jgi:hypothetical protein
MEWEEFLSPLLLIVSDLKAATAELKPLDVLPIIVWSLWIGALMSSLKRIDLRDDVTQLSYIGIISALGVILIAGVPAALGKPFVIRDSLILFVCFALAARLRWLIAGSSASQAIGITPKVLEKK